MPAGVSDRTGAAMALMSLTFLAVLIILVMSADPARSDLSDREPPNQYNTFDEAYQLPESQIGVPFEVRREGGGDPDYINLSFLSMGDLVSVEWDNSFNPEHTVEYWVHDPGRFAVAYHFYDGTGDYVTNMSFLVSQDGPYFLQTGLGFGETMLRVTVSRVADKGSSDGNDMPIDAVVIDSSTVIDDAFGQPMDPADFYRLDLVATDSHKLFLRFSLSPPAGSVAQWEFYDSLGIQRSIHPYTWDCWCNDSSVPFDDQIRREDSYYIRVWCIEGGGPYRLSVSMHEYFNDNNDDLANAEELMDGETRDGTIHSRYDAVDCYWFTALEGDLVRIGMEVDDDLDITLLDNEGLQRAASANWGTEEESIVYPVKQGLGGRYYIVITLSTELEIYPLRVINYRLNLLINLPPEVVPLVASEYGNWSMPEDTVSEGIDLGRLFRDPEGGPLTFRVATSHNISRINVTIVRSSQLRLEPAENLSGFVEVVTVEAVDDRGKRVTFTIEVTVTPVNDAPRVGCPGKPPPPGTIEMDEDSLAGPFHALEWFWDVDDPTYMLVIRAGTGPGVRAEVDVYGRITLRTDVEDWNGETTLAVRAIDPGGLWAELDVEVLVRPVNDPPRPVLPGLTVDVNEALSATVDLGGAFFDVEGDAMTLSADSALDVGLAIAGWSLEVSRLLPHQGTTVVVLVTATDVQGASSEALTVNVQVGDLPDPHTVTRLIDNYTVVEGQQVSFVGLVVDDPDTPPSHYEVLLVVEGGSTWVHLMVTEDKLYWTDGEPVWTPEVTWVDRKTTATMYVVDEWYNVSVSWTVEVRHVNRPPRGVSIDLPTKGPFHPSDEITLTGHALDDDGDLLTLRWIVDGEEAGRSPTLILRGLPPGEHDVTLVVSDGVDEADASTVLAVVEWQDGGGRPNVTWVIPMAVVVAVAVGAAVLLGRRQ